MTTEKVRRLLLLTDDNFLAEVLGTYLRRDDIEVERARGAEEVLRSIGSGADGIVIDIAKRGLGADAIMNLTSRAEVWDIPVVILSAQARRDLSDFATVVRATDVASKTESMTTIAARIRLCLRTPLRRQQASQRKAEPVAWALA
jgi:DNA-binding response OmpR family regulator